MGLVKDAFNQEYINKLNALNLRLQSKMKGGYSGNRRSKAKGSSTEFSDFKDYIRGDDIRRIDWNSYARLNKLFIKIYEEEKQANINIFLDISKSMDFGNPNKFVYGRVLAASLVYAAVNAADRANIFTINNSLSLPLKSLTSKAAFAKALDFLDGLEAVGETSFSESFKNLGQMNLGSGLNVILSDFFDREGYEQAFKTIRAKAGNSFALQLLSPEEINPSYTGGIHFVDNESGAGVDLDMDEIVIKHYMDELNEYNNRLALCCRENAIEHVIVQTDTPYMEWLWKMRA